jgi:hypothetical protein
MRALRLEPVAGDVLTDTHLGAACHARRLFETLWANSPLVQPTRRIGQAAAVGRAGGSEGPGGGANAIEVGSVKLVIKQLTTGLSLEHPLEIFNLYS